MTSVSEKKEGYNLKPGEVAMCWYPDLNNVLELFYCTILKIGPEHSTCILYHGKMFNPNNIRGKYHDVCTTNIKPLDPPDIAMHILPDANNGWINPALELPPIDAADNFNLQHNISIDVLTFTRFGIKRGRYYKAMKQWTIDGVSSSNGVDVTHWQRIPEPPKF